MIGLIKPIVLMIFAATSTSAFAQTAPVPRPPLGPGSGARQFPMGLQQQLPAVDLNSVSVSNLGDSTLQFSSWDGDGWKPFQVLSRQTVTITCQKCGNEIAIAFHDGTENRTANARTGDNYALFWDQAQLRWDFMPLAVFMQRKGRFR
jgi:hypothetical protein